MFLCGLLNAVNNNSRKQKQEEKKQLEDTQRLHISGSGLLSVRKVACAANDQTPVSQTDITMVCSFAAQAMGKLRDRSS